MDAIYVVVNGESKGPYSLAQVQELLASGGITRETLAWYQGAADWAPLGNILPATGAMPAAPPVPAPAISSVATEADAAAFTKDELRRIAKAQNLLMWSVLAGFTAFFVSHIPVLGIPIVLAIVAFQIYALYTLGQALRFSLPIIVVLCLCMFIPCVSLLLLVLVSGRASKILKAAGVRVGLMGGHAEDIKD